MKAINDGIKEFVPAFKFGFVGLAWVMGDLVTHQFFPVTAGHATPPGYYGAKLLWAMPLLITGRIVSDFVGGSPFVRALTIGAVATSLMQTQYFWTAGFKFNITVFLIHLAFFGTPLPPHRG